MQTFLFVASLVGTGTIFLMIVGALEVSLGIRNQFKNALWSFVLTLYDKFHCYVVILFSGGVIDSWTSFMVNLIPVLFFIGMCYICKSETQVDHYHVSWIFEKRNLTLFLATTCKIQSKLTLDMLQSLPELSVCCHNGYNFSVLTQFNTLLIKFLYISSVTCSFHHDRRICPTTDACPCGNYDTDIRGRSMLTQCHFLFLSL